MALSPKITFPTDSLGYSTNLVNQTILGTTESNTASILVNDSTAGVSYASGNTNWGFTTMLENGDNVFNIVAVDVFGTPSAATSITITLTSEDNLNLVIDPPTGITFSRSRDSVEVSVIENKEPEIIGYNFYGSEEPGGGSEGFTLLNRTLVRESSFFREETVVLSENIETVGNIKTTNKVEQLQRNNYYSFAHNRRTQPLGNRPISEPNHYVVTAVGFDPDTLQQVESAYSGEVGASPVILDTSIRDLTVRSTTDVQQSYIDQILSVNSDVDVKPGTVTRDVHINPPSDEFERLYTVLDFLHRSQSFLTLLEFDDANKDGISDPVLESENKIRLKEALQIPDERADDVQRLIDDSFDKLAGNVNVPRKSALPALGQALFYTRSVPNQDVSINAGGIIETVSEGEPAVQFQVLTDFTLRVADLENYYNPQTDRYEVSLDIQALNPGNEGNVDASKIRVIVSGINPIFGVTNPNPTDFGQDQESNADLAQRAILAFVSVDVGTEGGYLSTALGTPNVSRARIISAGEPLMMRDIDPLRLVHTFGMVDIYVYGSKQTTVTEQFGFNYEISRNEQAVIQSANLFHFRVQNENVNIDKPIYDVVSVVNATKGAAYDITDFEIINDGQVIDLNESLPTNVAVGLDPTDVILVTYRFRESQPYIFLRQPVESIVSVEGEISGFLSESNYQLRKLEDPLQFGNSTSSSDQMQLVFGNGVPSGEVIDILGEQILLFAENPANLERYGIDVESIQITNLNNTQVYTRDLDYVIVPGNANSYTAIRRTPNSSIPSGSSVLVDYSAGENFTVRYNINSLLEDVQERINHMKHLTADVVIKGAIRTFIDIDMKVVIEEGSDQTSIDRRIRTALARLLREKQIGESVYQSDIVHAVEENVGVSHVEIPFTKMVKANGSYSINEDYVGSFEPFQTVNVTAYRSVGTLKWETIEGGGPETLFKGVFENDIPYTMVSSASEVSEQEGRAYIDSEGRLYISPFGSVANARVTSTYVVQDAMGSRDIEFSEIEYGAIGDLTITFDFVRKFRGF